MNDKFALWLPAALLGGLVAVLLVKQGAPPLAEIGTGARGPAMPPPVVDLGPPPKGPLPKICAKPKKRPPPHLVKPEDVTWDIQYGERADRMTCTSDKFCTYWSVDNAHDYAQAHLYARDEAGNRAPHGADVNCLPPFTVNDGVTCQVSVTNPNFDRTEIVTISCDATRRCARGVDCCSITSRERAFKKYEEPSRAELFKWDRERVARQRARARTCSQYCVHPEWRDKCVEYWNYVND